jgi:Fe-S-cluster-containing hydrogenase component 2
MKVNRKIIQIDEALCSGCGQCVPSCAEGALKIVDGKAKLVAEVYCDGLGACLGECPTGALKIIEREADDFDEKAVEEMLKSSKGNDHSQNACGCPSATPQTFVSGISCKKANEPVNQETHASALTHWPVQIRLVPPNAPFLKGSDLLVVADCAALSYANLHRDFIAGKAVLMGCQKFDNAQEYVEKFADIFRVAGIKGITIPVMEVPCCQGLPVIVQKGLELSGKQIPINKVVISRQGEIISSELL